MIQNMATLAPLTSFLVNFLFFSATVELMEEAKKVKRESDKIHMTDSVLVVCQNCLLAHTLTLTNRCWNGSKWHSST